MIQCVENLGTILSSKGKVIAKKPMWSFKKNESLHFDPYKYGFQL